MNNAYKWMIAFALGNAIGFVLGPISIISINARNVLRSHEDWPNLDLNYVDQLLYTSIPAEINGVIGCCVAILLRDYRRKPVLILPVAMHIVSGITILLVEPQSFFGIQMYTLIFTVVIYSAGRLGQHIASSLFSEDDESDQSEIQN